MTSANSAVPANLWPAPLGAQPLQATVEVPGSKSLTNRYLVLAALAAEKVQIRGGLRSRDSDLMISALTSLGIGFQDLGSHWEVTPGPIHPSAPIACGLAGTVMRFLPPLALLTETTLEFDGDPEARRRPMGPLLAGLSQLGAQIEPAGAETLPFRISGGTPTTNEVRIDASGSSQFVTGLLLVAPHLPQGLTVRHIGEKLPSLPHIDMTCAALRAAGVQVDQPDERTWIVHPGPIRLPDIQVEPDLSNAGPFLAAALVVGGSVTVPNWPTDTTQPGALYVDLLTRMGAQCELSAGALRVSGDGVIKGITADLSRAGELTPTIAALAALADSPSRLTGIGHLRGHETDRLAALSTEITRIGGNCEATADELLITPPGHGFTAATMETYHDHRMATFAAIIGLRIPGIQVRNVQTVSKTMPDFVAMWQQMLEQTA